MRQLTGVSRELNAMMKKNHLTKRVKGVVHVRHEINITSKEQFSRVRKVNNSNINGFDIKIDIDVFDVERNDFNEFQCREK